MMPRQIISLFSGRVILEPLVDLLEGPQGSAIDDEFTPGDIGSPVRCQEGHEFGDFFGTTRTILLQLLKIRFILLPGDIPNVSATDEKLPLILGNGLGMMRTVKLFRRASAPIAEGPCVARIAKDFERRAVEQRSPVDLAFVRTGANTTRKEQRLCAKILYRGRG